MKKDDFISSAEMLALSKMDPVSKRSDNTQIILMYERLSSGRKVIEKVFDELMDAVIDDNCLDMKICTHLKEFEKIQKNIQNTLTGMKTAKEQSDLDRDALDKIEQDVKSLNQLSEMLNHRMRERTALTERFAEAVKSVGGLSQDPFYVYDNAIFRNKLQSAVTCHKEWMKTMRKMIETKGQIPEQLNEHLCGFGLCYDSLHPKNTAVSSEWENLGRIHENLHDKAKRALEFMKNGDKEKSRTLYLDMRDLSDELLRICEGLQKTVKLLEKKKESVFLNIDMKNDR